MEKLVVRQVATDHEALALLTTLKTEGNAAYSQAGAAEGDARLALLEAAIAAYSRAAAHVPDYDDDEPLPEVISAATIQLRQQGAIVFANRAAAHMGLNKAVAALADAHRAADLDPSFWKAHWRAGLALMMMGVRLERSEQAIAAFKRVLACKEVPPSERLNVQKALSAAEYRLREGRDALDMPDMAQCVVC